MKRILYIDNLRVVLTCLVIVHHLAITYGAIGMWYIGEQNSNLISSSILTFIVAVNQSFFMGLFFFLSSYFLFFSMQRKKAIEVFKDRINRFGIPIIIYVFVLAPIVNGLKCLWENGDCYFYDFIFQCKNFDVGPLWFLIALLIFTLLTLFFRDLLLSEVVIKPIRRWKIIIGVLLLCFITFLIRTSYPVGRALPVVGFQLGHFAQYALFFVLGLLCARFKCIEHLASNVSRKFYVLTLLHVVVVLPLIFLLNLYLKGDVNAFLGGVTWQSLLYSFWEQLAGILISLILLNLAKRYFDIQNRIWVKMSASAYAVYIIHPVVLVGLSFILKNIEVSSFCKFLIMTPLGVVVSFVVGSMLKSVQLFKSVL